ncbi:cytochrome c6, chloroplastic isoform X3 [Populus trichocarpa]|uniref:cytochrome c6, chloroplastic isoform X3 n=1 Tax=Populus trichocarpa TaxID=3694 RepID=UPI002278150C|nr:cytochrome c6, chloroplastic isoform X3 [Populus trichocarpa]
MYFVAYNSSTIPLACLHRLLHLRSLATNLKPNPKMWIPSVMSCCSHGPYNSLLMKGNEKQGESQNPVVLKQKEVKLVKSLAPPLMAALVALSPIVNTPVSLGQTLDVQRGASLFSRTCIGCHDAGGNIIQPGATLFTKDLQRSRNKLNDGTRRNGVDTEEEIYRITYFGKGRMPIV